MKAVVITVPGGPEVMTLQERPDPVPAAGEVLVQVKAAGVNRPDIAQRKGHYPPPADASPDIPGLEVAGIIIACGPGVTVWKEGDAICALTNGGGYSEKVTVPAGQCLPLPKGWDFTEAAGLPETVFTVWSNVFQRGALKPGERLLVHGGSSGIGITAIQLASAFGSEVFVTVGSAEKGATCLALGATGFVNYKTQDFAAEWEETDMDVILDMIGGSYFEKNLRLLRPDGRLVYINAMQGRNVSLDIMQVMQKRLIITGSTLRPRDAAFKAALAQDIRLNVWPLLESGKFKAVVHAVIPLEEAARAHALMESGTHIGKIILQVS